MARTACSEACLAVYLHENSFCVKSTRCQRDGTPVFGSSYAVPPQKSVGLFSVRVGCSVARKFRPCLNFIRPSWNGWNGTRLFVVVVPFQAVCVHTEFQATEQPTRTETNPTDFCGGTAQLDPKTGVPSRGQRVLLTQNEFSCKYTARQASEQAVRSIQVTPSRKV